MIILIQRILKRADEKNTVVAFDRSFSLDFERKRLRDHNGEMWFLLILLTNPIT